VCEMLTKYTTLQIRTGFALAEVCALQVLWFLPWSSSSSSAAAAAAAASMQTAVCITITTTTADAIIADFGSSYALLQRFVEHIRSIYVHPADNCRLSEVQRGLLHSCKIPLHHQPSYVLPTDSTVLLHTRESWPKSDRDSANGMCHYHSLGNSSNLLY